MSGQRAKHWRTHMTDIYKEWWSKYGGTISTNIFNSIVPEDNTLLWSPRGRYSSPHREEYRRRLHACYAETAMLASEALHED